MISERYVRDLHELHEKWLVEGQEYVPAPVMVVNADNDIGDMARVFSDISDKILSRKDDVIEDNAVVEKTFDEDFSIHSVICIHESSCWVGRGGGGLVKENEKIVEKN